MRFLSVVLTLVAASTTSAQQSDALLPSDVTFNLRRSFLEELRTGGPNNATVGARFTASLKMGDHSAVHVLD